MMVLMIPLAAVLLFGLFLLSMMVQIVIGGTLVHFHIIPPFSGESIVLTSILSTIFIIFIIFRKEFKKARTEWNSNI
jgi:NhaP-type Na+/H+ or K+/H+ antiporter